MTKNEQIEEMARIACEHFDYDMVDQPCTKCKTHDKHCYTIHQAEILYNAGYRKIDDDCAVITKAELKQYNVQAVKEFAERLKEYRLESKNLVWEYVDGWLDCHKSVKKAIDELIKDYEK